MGWTQQATILGPQGVPGPPGAQGPQGEQGLPGSPGPGTTPEEVQDVVAAMLTAGTNIALTYDDVAGTLTITATAGGAAYTDEQAQDAVGAMLLDTATIALTYTDATPSLTAAVIAGSIGTTQLANSNVTYAKMQNVSTTDRLLGRSTAGAGVVEEIVCTPFARTLLDDTTQAAMQTTLGVPATSAVQPLDATLTALAGLATGANQLPYATGTDTFAQTPLTAAGRALLDDADAAAQRTTLGLGTVATQSYSEGSYTATATGFSGTAPSGTAYYVQVGKQVTLTLPAITGTSNATGFTLTGLPAALFPARQQVGWATLTDNGVNFAGLLVLQATGVLTLAQSNYLGFTASGTKGLNGGNTFTYTLL